MTCDATETSAHAREVEELLLPQRKALAALSRSPAIAAGDVATALAQIAAVASELLHVERASVWRFDQTNERIVCDCLFERTTRGYRSGMFVEREHAPTYFDALATERSIAANDAENDPRTHELAERYLRPLGIGSMLDAPFFVGGAMAGVVCHEHVGGLRTWKPWEELIAAMLADFAALVFTAAERAHAERALAEHRAHLEKVIEERTLRLQDSEAGLRRLFDAAPIALVLSKTSDGSIVMGNRRAAQVFDVPYPQIEGLRAADFWANKEERKQMMREAATTGRSEAIVVPMRTRSGREFFGEVTAVQLVFEGESSFLVGVQDVTQQRKADEALRELATRDSLTGVSNRRHFFELAEIELERSTRYERPVALALMDVDYFKRVNDRYGHATGDLVLKSVAVAARNELRAADVLARYGGEEFVVLLPETTRDDAERVIERMRRAIAAASFTTEEGEKHVTVSVGLIGRESTETIVAMLKRADEAMYEAKAKGRNRMMLR
jgi:diguanylate cyclase (GGDEF)-like protein/PAS domain S-box-containing protein